MNRDTVNILLVDDDPAKLLSYEVVLRDLDATLYTAATVRETFQRLLQTDIGIILMDVSMPELDGFQLAGMIREHPRYHHTAIIFVSAVHFEPSDFIRGYEMGAVDYVTVPVVPEILRAKTRVFAELHRKTRELEALNRGLEDRVKERTHELEAAATQLRESEQRRNEALAAGQMGSWDWEVTTGVLHWDDGQFRILGYEPGEFALSLSELRRIVPREEFERLSGIVQTISAESPRAQAEFRVRRADGELGWYLGTAAASVNAAGAVMRISGVTIDITERKRAEERQALLAGEVDHRAKNALAVVQSIIRLSKSDSIDAYRKIVEGRINALSRAHTLLAASRWKGADLLRLATEEVAPYQTEDNPITIEGGPVSLDSRQAQAMAVALHELITNAAKHGALAVPVGRVHLRWKRQSDILSLSWIESGVATSRVPSRVGFGLRVIEASVTGQLQGSANFDWGPTGLRCDLLIPLGPDLMEAKAGVTTPATPISDDRPAVLLVEDEALIAMMMEELLQQLGYRVEGPFRTLPDALQAAKVTEVTAALLDINLGSDRVYPAADVLAARGIRLAFVTGFGTETVAPSYARHPLIQKPASIEALERFLSQA